MSPLRTDIEVELVGTDGNAMAILGKVTAALKKGGFDKEEIAAFYTEATSGDYDKLLRTVMETVVVL